MEYVFDIKNARHYRFPTHVNDLIVDRADAATSEVFMVVLEPGESAPLHIHDDTEQIFYVLEGRGVLTVGTEEETIEAVPGMWSGSRPPHGTGSRRSANRCGILRWTVFSGEDRQMSRRGMIMSR